MQGLNNIQSGAKSFRIEDFDDVERRCDIV